MCARGEWWFTQNITACFFDHVRMLSKQNTAPYWASAITITATISIITSVIVIIIMVLHITSISTIGILTIIIAIII